MIMLSYHLLIINSKLNNLFCPVSDKEKLIVDKAHILNNFGRCPDIGKWPSMHHAFILRPFVGRFHHCCAGGQMPSSSHFPPGATAAPPTSTQMGPTDKRDIAAFNYRTSHP